MNRSLTRACALLCWFFVAASMPLSAVRAELKAAPGRKVRLKMVGGAERVVTTRDLS